MDLLSGVQGGLGAAWGGGEMQALLALAKEVLGGADFLTKSIFGIWKGNYNKIK